MSTIPFSHLSLLMNCNQHNKLHSFKFCCFRGTKEIGVSTPGLETVPATGIVLNFDFALGFKKANGCVTSTKASNVQCANSSVDLGDFREKDYNKTYLNVHSVFLSFTENCDLCNLALFDAKHLWSEKIKLEEVCVFFKKLISARHGLKNRFSSNIVQHISVSQRRIQDFPGALTPNLLFSQNSP